MSCSNGQPESYFHTLNVSEATERVRNILGPIASARHPGHSSDPGR